MRWSLKIGRVSGIGLYLHITLLLLLALIGYTGFVEMGTRGALWSLALVVAILACIMLHELGHSLVAQRLGVQVKSITLLPIGGVAALKGIPEKPWHELVITIAGPLVNLVIAGLLLPFTGRPPHLFFISMPYNLQSFLFTVVSANLTLFVFNFIPAFPMDGGRLLRASLALVMSGLEMVYHTGQDDFPVMDGDRFLGIVTRQDMLDAANRAGADVPVSEVMSTTLPAVPPHTKLFRTYEMMMTEGYPSLPVVENGRLVGLLSHDNVSRYLMVQSHLKPLRRPPTVAGRMPAPPPVIRDAPPTATPPTPAEPPPPTAPV